MIKINVNCLNLDETLDCGQCFRWEKDQENRWIGIIKDRVIRLKLDNNILIVESNNEENLEKIIKDYLDLNVNYSEIEKLTSKIDDNVKIATDKTTGIRILNQDKFEVLISFIISANNNIPRIKKSIDLICQKYGQKVTFFDKEYYLFPEPKSLVDVKVEEYRTLGVGFRDKYIEDTVKRIVENKNILDDMANLNNESLKKELIKFRGVGPKVADCIMLFAYDRKDAFPIDTWIKKIMQRLYYNDKEIDNKKILKDSLEMYGEYAGIVQQHLFQSVRKGII